MSTISYNCDTCKRDIELLENIQGITVFSKCVITDGCKGKLHVTARNPDSIREEYPQPITGLQNYSPRRVFYSHIQENLTNIWKFIHNLSVEPSITIYCDENGQLVEIDENDYIVDTLDDNNTIITFNEPKSGVAHLIARSSVPITPKIEVSAVNTKQLSKDGLITFAVPEFINFTTPVYDMATTNIQVAILLEVPDEEVQECIETITPTIDANSPWFSWDKILLRNRRVLLPRTTHILDFNVFEDSTFKLSDIENGTTLRFTRIRFGDDTLGYTKWYTINSRLLFILLSQTPHSNVDKLLGTILDMGELVNEEYDYLTFIDGELFANESSLDNVYPDISRITT